MKFYFYTNKNILFDFLGRNIIAPDPIVKDIKRYRTIATASNYFLFITHKKLDRKSREQGIAEPEFVYPVTLELSEVQENDGQAVLVSRSEMTLEYILAPLSEYDAEKHIGVPIKIVSNGAKRENIIYIRSNSVLVFLSIVYATVNG